MCFTHSDAIVVPLIAAPYQPRMMDDLHTDMVKERNMTPFERNIESSTTNNPIPQEIGAEQTEVASTIQKHSSVPHIEMENENNIPKMLMKFKDAVTKPLESCLLMTPTFKPCAKEEQNEGQKRSPIPKTNLRKQMSTIKMALKELTLQQYLDIYKKPTFPSALLAIKML
jgi:hypothetical protein